MSNHSHKPHGEETLALLEQFQNYRAILDNGPNFALLWASKKWMSFSLSGHGLTPLTPWPGALIPVPAGGSAPDRRYRLAQSARHPPTQGEFSDAPLLNNVVLCFVEWRVIFPVVFGGPGWICQHQRCRVLRHRSSRRHHHDQERRPSYSV